MREHGWKPVAIEEDGVFHDGWAPEVPGITVGQLRELLEEYPEDAVIRVAQQPSYPLRARLTNVTWLGEGGSEARGFVWLATSERHSDSESPYAPREAWDGVSIEEEM